MAYDPQDPLSSISGELAKRGKKNQTSRFEDRNKVNVSGPAGKPMQVSGTRIPGGLMAVSPEDLAKAAAQQRVATGQFERPQSGMGDVRMAERNPEPVQPRGLFGMLAGAPPQPARGGYFEPPPPAAEPIPQTTRPKGLFGRLVGGEVRETTQPRAGMGDVRMREREVEQPVATQPTAKQPVPQVGPPPARPRMDTADAMFGDTGLQVIGEAMRQAPPPQRGLTREMNEQILRDVMSGEAQRLRQVKREDEALSRAFPDVSFRPRQQTAQAAQPTTAEQPQGFVGPERRSARDRADQLRAQIASEQQAMLKARRARGGSFTEDAAQLERIGGMRQELAQYERAGQPIQQINVKTPEANLATEQSLARQASDIMVKDVEDLRRQVATMPAGPARDAEAERLRSLEYQQQQQASRAGVLGPGAVGPQPAGASTGMYEQMMGEARARTQRQQEAAPRVAARQQELADVAMREGERLTGKRQDIEQRQKDLQAATQAATLAELSAPERMRQEAIAGEQAKRSIAERASGREDRESAARIDKISAETGMMRSQAKMLDENVKAMGDDAAIARDFKKAELETKNLSNALLKAQIAAQSKGMNLDPQMAAMEDAAASRSIKNLNLDPQSESNVQQAIAGLKQNMSKTTYTVPSDAATDLQRAMQVNNFARNLKILSEQGGVGRDLARGKAQNLLTALGGEITGQRTSAERSLGIVGSATAGGALAGGGIGLVGGPAGAGAGVTVGGITGLVAGTVAAATDALAQSFGWTSEEVERIKSQWNESVGILQQIAR